MKRVSVFDQSSPQDTALSAQGLDESVLLRAANVNSLAQGLV
jgi:hypothetical protein